MKTQELNGKTYCKFSEVIRDRNTYIDYVDKNTYAYVGEYDLLVWLDYNHKNEYIIIPKGFVFDFGSVPTFFRWISEKDDYVSYMVHDYLYQKDGEVFIIDEENLSETFEKLEKYGFGMKYRTDEQGEIQNIFKYNRKFADKILLQFITDEDIEVLRQKKIIKHDLIYGAVRLGGNRHFRENPTKTIPY